MYGNDMIWTQWTDQLMQCGGSLLSSIERGKQMYDKWAALTYGKTDAEIQALPQFATKTVADITAMRYAWGVFADIYNAMHNLSALPQANREGYLTPFI
jgi:hypothetical protein